MRKGSSNTASKQFYERRTLASSAPYDCRFRVPFFRRLDLEFAVGASIHSDSSGIYSQTASFQTPKAIVPISVRVLHPAPVFLMNPVKEGPG